MYKIRGQDQVESGPFTAVVIRQWIAAGKTDSQTMLLKVGESEWKLISEFSEFGSASDFSAADGLGATALRSDTRARGSAEDNDPPSNLAVASILLGVVGIAGITALAGLVLGIMALKTSRNEGRRGRGTILAIAGTVLSGCMLLVAIPAITGLWLVPILVDRQERQTMICYDRVQALSKAIQTYIAAHGDRFPEARKWSDALVEANLLSAQDPIFRCPTRPTIRCSFAFNQLLSGVAATNVAGDTVVFFESDLGWNGHGGFSNMVTSRHARHVILGFANGSASLIPAWQIPQLRWIPTPSP